MRVILKQDVRHLGRMGDMVNVASGFARNYLFPRKLAAEATQGRVKEYEHWQRVSESKKKKALENKTATIDAIKKVNLTFKLAAGETDKLFGSVTSKDIADELAKLGHQVEKREVVLPEPIKVLGSHKVKVSFGEGLEAEIPVSVERQEAKEKTEEAPKAEKAE